jgi:hypothetical protein
MLNANAQCGSIQCGSDQVNLMIFADKSSKNRCFGALKYHFHPENQCCQELLALEVRMPPLFQLPSLEASF